MKSITLDRFDLGMDRRKGRGISDANRLFDLKNCHVTSGWGIAKRPGLTKVAQLAPGSVGLMGFDGKLNTFSAVSDPAHPAASNGVAIDNYQVPYSADAGDDVKAQHFTEVFNGAIYAAIEYNSGNVEHHFINGSAPWHITDVNCPHSKAGLRIAEKIMAVDGDVVGYCATGDPTDWTSAGDAGFLPTGLRTPGTPDALALGNFNKQLAVFMTDAVQLWAVDPDPALNALDKEIPNVGTEYPGSVHAVADDLFFLAPNGYRSVALQKFTNNAIELDVGTPIDAIVKPSLTPDLEAKATYYSGGGQYWNSLGNNTVHVYSWSRSAEVSAWSRYLYPLNFDYHTILGSELYVRSGNSVYLVDPEYFRDDQTAYEVLVDFSFLSFKKPGILKQIIGVDVVAEGAGEIAHRYNADNPDEITAWVPFEGDTRNGRTLPVELMTTEIAPVVRNNDDQPFRLDAITYYYEELGQL